jgi:uncharacterized protein (TIGR02145 family)
MYHIKPVFSALLRFGAMIYFLTSHNDAFCQSAGSSHSCGAPNIHNSALTYGQASDIDGNFYKTIIIDNLVWFAENLKTTRFQNGDSIPNVSDSAAWAALTGPGMCSYQNNTANDCPYGKLYNFFVAADSRNPCPNGWRVPSITDYNNLINYYDSAANGGAPSSLPNSAGGFLKSTGLNYWQSPNTGANNSSGFSAIPNGGRNNLGAFSFTNNSAASYWYSSLVGPGMGFFLQLPYNQEFAVRNGYWAEYGCCIRCVTDVITGNNYSNKLSTVSIYPNPTSDYIKMSFNQLVIGSKYVINDLTGRQLLSGSIVSENMIVSLAALPSGMYLLSIPASGLGVYKIIKE